MMKSREVVDASNPKSLSGSSWVGTSEWAGVPPNPLARPAESELELHKDGSSTKFGGANKSVWRQKGNRVYVETYTARALVHE